MENKKFKDCSKHQDNADFIKCKKLHKLNDIIEISGENNGQRFVIWLDKKSAVEFMETLRTEINKIQ